MIAAKPYVGALISYRFLWPSDHDKGFDCAESTQPCVVMAVQDLPDWTFKVLVCPITHTPRAEDLPIAIPDALALRAKLDGRDSFVVSNALNILVWPSNDVVPLEVGNRSTLIRGDLPKEFLKEIGASIAMAKEKNKLRIIDRPQEQEKLVKRRKLQRSM
jgi:hypothetical protein